MSRAVVVGAGIIGASVAYRLAEAGWSVTILEANRAGSGTSSVSFAWTNANEKTPKSYHDLNVAGMRAHAALKEEFGEAPWLLGGGSIEWRTHEAEAGELRERVNRLRGWGYEAHWITKSELHDLEPTLTPGASQDAEIAYFPEEGWVDPAVYVSFFIAAAQRRGAVLQHGRVTDILVQNGVVQGARTAGGDVISADVVVNCTGRWARDVSQSERFQIPMTPSLGFLVFTPPVAAGVRRIVRTPLCNLRPDGAGRLMLQHEPFEQDFTFESPPDPSCSQALEMVRRASLLFPHLAEVLPEAVRIGGRAIPGDGLSAVGPVPDVEGYYLAVTHSGVTLAPYLGRVAADEIAGGRQHPALDEFRPARFF
jgi:glycine/D-amino acid oxidase-like deaminating enzyme